MVAVDDCEANSHGFCLGAFDDWEEFAVAAGAPDDFLRAHFSVPVDAQKMFSVCSWIIGSVSHKNEWKIDNGCGYGGGARVSI